MKRNHQIIDDVKDITMSLLSNNNTVLCEENGEACATFMEVVYNKLVDLNNREDDRGLPTK